jgi:signal transduction histidine kinase
MIPILLLSLALQFAAVFFALRLIKVTGKSLAWSLIAAAIALMALRRGISLVEILSTGQTARLDVFVELIALAISALMAAGIWLITPIFKELRSKAVRLSESEERYRLVFENSPVSLWEEDFSGVKHLFDDLRKAGVTDIEAYFASHPEALAQCAGLAKVVAVNRAALSLHGAKTAQELLAGLATTFTPESFDTFKQELICLWNGGTEMSREAVVKTLAGELRYVTVYFSVCPGYEDTLSRVIVSLADISGRRHAEEKVHQFNQELEQRVAERTAQLETAVYDLENFNYSASHDLRIPLRAVEGFSKILMDDYAPRLDAEGLRLLNVVRDNTKKIAQYIDDMLAFSSTGRMSMAPAKIAMEDLVREVEDEFKPLIAGRDLKIEINALPSIVADRAMMRRVILSLLSNAIKFTRFKAAARIEVGAQAGETETVFFVKDNGAGFDMRYAHKLFGVFQRLHGVEEFEGTGIGLAIVKRIITRHGGRVWAEGKVGEGATVYFSIPQSALTSGEAV